MLCLWEEGYPLNGVSRECLTITMRRARLRWMTYCWETWVKAAFLCPFGDGAFCYKFQTDRHQLAVFFPGFMKLKGFHSSLTRARTSAYSHKHVDIDTHTQRHAVTRRHAHPHTPTEAHTDAHTHTHTQTYRHADMQTHRNAATHRHADRQRYTITRTVRQTQPHQHTGASTIS